MTKKSQITLFIILGIAMIVFFVFMFTTKEKVEEKKTEKATIKTLLLDSELQSVKTYVEGCLRKVSDDLLFNKSPVYFHKTATIGYNGVEYPVLYDSGWVIGDGGYTGEYFYNKSINEIEENLSKNILVEFEKCLNLSVFENIYNITKPDINYENINVTINMEDIDIKTINYSIVLLKKNSEGKLDNFKVNLPIRLGLIYNNITINLLKNISGYEFYTPGAEEYDLSDYCDGLIPGGCTGNANTISKIDFIETVEDDKGIIVIEDNRTRQYAKSFNLTFGLLNVNITGGCGCDLS